MNELDFKQMAKLISIAVPIIIIGAVASCGLQVVDTGHRGVKTQFGKVVSESLPEGLYFFNPFTSAIHEMDVRESKYEEETMAYTKDVQNVKVVYTINYHPDSTQMHDLYAKVGIGWENKIIPQVVLGKIKEVVGQFEAVKLVADRHTATQAIFEKISEDFKAKNIIVKNFELTNIDFNDPFEHAVEAKVVAIQQAEEAKNKTVRVREEAEQQIITAKAQAESMRTRANALSQNKNLVEYEAVQKWDGKLPDTVMGDGVPFINLKAAAK